MQKRCPELKFYKKIANLLDLQKYYKDYLVKTNEKESKQSKGLDTVCFELLGLHICKGERMSNWEKRPLR